MLRRSKPILKLRQPHLDGVGSQLLRIFSTFAIAKEWKLDFCYEPISSIGDEVFQKGQSDLNIWNNFLQRLLPMAPDVCQNSRLQIIHKNHRPVILHSSIKLLDIFRIPTTHIIDSPQVITNENAKMLAAMDFEDSIRALVRKRKSKKLKIILHIRQGELALSQFQDRYLPLVYFETFLSSLIPKLDSLNIPFEVLITSEPGKGSLVRADHPRIAESIRLNPKNPNLIYVNQGNYRLVHEKPSRSITPHLFDATWLAPNSSWNDFNLFLSADILVLSKSSFSYLAGILNKSAIVVCPDFWHPPLPGWYSVNDSNKILKSLQYRMTVSGKNQ